jgi:hypothetical protein
MAAQQSMTVTAITQSTAMIMDGPVTIRKRFISGEIPGESHMSTGLH